MFGNTTLTHNTFNCLVLIWIGIALLLFPILLKVTAPYGRHSKTSWGLMINNRLAWIIMELPSLVLVLYSTTSLVPIFWVKSLSGPALPCFAGVSHHWLF